MKEPGTHVTALLHALRSSDAGESQVRGQLYTAVYDELSKVAAGLMLRERVGHTLEPGALVHEVYLKLVDRAEIDWKDRAHFYGVATRAMRQILVDHARRRDAEKRGGGWARITLTGLAASRPDPIVEIIDLEELLDRLAQLSERTARVVELRVFGGMTHEEIAASLGVSVRTIADDWSIARRWLARELASRDGPGA